MKSAAGDRIGNVKVEMKEETEGNILFVPETKEKLFSPRKELVKIITEVKKISDKGKKECNTLNRLQLHKESSLAKPTRGEDDVRRREEKKVVGRSKRSTMRTVVLRKEDPAVRMERLKRFEATFKPRPSSKLEVPSSKFQVGSSNSSPWQALLSQAARHFRTEDAETIRKMRMKMPQQAK